MIVKVVTDSTADLPVQLAREFDITVVPAYVHFGYEAYRDRVDISEDDFYRRLLSGPVLPSTSPPTPQDFCRAYQELAREADGIISIHISGKLSATVNSALRGKELLANACPVEVIDSQLATMGTGLLTTAAHDIALSGDSLMQIASDVRQIIPKIQLLGYMDTLKYLALGGRIGKAKAMLSSILNQKPMLTMKDGELEPAGKVKSLFGGLDRLFNTVKNSPDIQDLAIVYSTTPEVANILAEQIDPVFPRERIKLARLGPVLGVHAGPGIIFVAIRVKSVTNE